MRAEMKEERLEDKGQEEKRNNKAIVLNMSPN